MSIEINGIAHVMLTAADFERSRAFYGELLPYLGLKPVFDGDGFFYCVGGRTAFGIESGDPALVRELAAEAGAHLVAVGWLERRDFPDQALAAVAAAGEVVLVRDDALLVRMAPPPERGADQGR